MDPPDATNPPVPTVVPPVPGTPGHWHGPNASPVGRHACLALVPSNQGHAMSSSGSHPSPSASCSSPAAQPIAITLTAPSIRFTRPDALIVASPLSRRRELMLAISLSLAMHKYL